MTEELSNKFYLLYGNFIGNNSYFILNENAYNYRNSRVVVHYWHKAKHELYPKLLYLKDIYNSALSVETKSRCYDGSTPFDKKEKNMIIANSISAPTALWNVAEAAKTVSDNFNTLSTSIKNKYSNLIYDGVYEKFEEVKENKNRKESKKMFENAMKNFEFGKCDEYVKMSVYGPAFRGYDGNYIAFNDDEAIDVTGMTFDFDCFYKMPVAQDDVKIGDYVYHLGDPVKVIDVTERGSLVCVRLFSHEEITVVPIKNMFGFNFFTKLVNFGEGLFGANTIDKSNPFGSILPFFLMSKGDKNNNLMMAMMLSQGNLDFKSNPFMMMALMSDNNSEMLPLLMMSQMAPKHECKCGKCNCELNNNEKTYFPDENINE